MATARQLPSGAWQTRATKVINGRKVTKSFTVHPRTCKNDSKIAREQSELLARQWRLNSELTEANGVTVQEALETFIADRCKVLSPSTITNYRRYLPYFELLMNISLSDIKTSEIQPLINEWSMSVSAKTIRNRISFLMAALDYAECDKKFRLRYPKSTARTIKAPDTEEVKTLLANAPDDFRPIIYLAAFGAMRRGEICALKQADIDRVHNSVHIHADMVLEGKKYVYKPFTKTAASGVIQLPRFVIKSLPSAADPESFVFPISPNVLSHRFDTIRKRLGFSFNFHSLRHFAASFRSDIGIPRKYIEEVGRWETGSVILERVYDNTLDSTRKKYVQITNKYLTENFKY
jgi:integrase